LKEKEMGVSEEQERLKIIHSILGPQSPLLSSVQSLVHLAISSADADDCAVYDLPGNLSLTIGSDYIRGTGFLLFQEHYLNYFDLGYYLVVANLSDIAAMGATPIGLTTVIRYTDQLEDAEFIELIRGMKQAALHYGAPIVGGDIGGSPEVVLAATALGVAEKGKYLTRKGTFEGDAVCVTGSIGLPSTALVYFTVAKKDGLKLSEEEERELLLSWKRPVARVREGIALAGLGVVHACQDVSDGLKATLDQLGCASRVSFEIHEAELPIHPITVKVASFLGTDPIALACGASVDFQLLFTLPKAAIEQVREALQPFPGGQLHVLGRAISSSEPSRLIRKNGHISAVPGIAWNQQTGDVTKVILGKI
jgi:thiamine-monophosphate kinase